MSVRFDVLGALQVRANGVMLPLGPPKQRTVLALLLINAGYAVALDALVDEVWPDGPPASAVANVRGYAANLRRMLEPVDTSPGRLVRHGSGYLLHAEPDELDLFLFESDCAAARAALRRNDLTAAAAGFAAACARRRGPTLTGVPCGPALAAYCVALEDKLLTVTEELAEVQLDLGEPSDAAARLRAHVQANPLRERGYELMMRALYQLGDVAGALSVYTEARGALVEHLGVEPGPALRALHTAVLNREGQAAPARRSTATPKPPVPAQLPPDLPGFVGRDRQLAQLDEIREKAAGKPTAVVVSALSGTAGVGKTALAVRWAQRLREEFPDGQLYVNLRGFDPSGSPVSPADALREFLGALGVPAPQTPAGVPARSALYRSLLASRRVLVLLDNARDAEQVRPLLPSSPGCLTVVTSRNQLPGLVVTEGARPLTLDLLTGPEAQALLAWHLGADRVADEPEAVDEIITRCARLPLALALTAARAATRPGLSLAAVAAELREASGGLDAFDSGDAVTDVRAVFSWSYRTLSTDAARLFRLLGFHPGPDIAPPAAASLAGLPVGRVRTALVELTRTHLVVERASGRYAFHDLLRAYAREQSELHDPQAERRAAMHRLLDHYLQTAHPGALLLNPTRAPISPPPAQPGVSPERLTHHGEAVAWLTAEHAALVAATGLAADAGFDTHTWQLAWTTATFFDRHGHWDDLAATHHAALDAARRLGDRSMQAHAHRGLGHAYARLGRHDEAHTHAQHALDLYQELDDPVGQARVHRALASIFGSSGRHEQALQHARQALRLLGSTGDRTQQASDLNAVGWHSAQLGDHQTALDHCREALSLYQEAGDRPGQANTWDSLGYVHHKLGQYEQAVICYQHALELIRDVGGGSAEADSLTGLGDTHLAAGNVDAARAAWQGAIQILEGLRHPGAEEIRARVDRLPMGSTGRA